MERVEFYSFSPTDQANMQDAVIVASYQGKWVFVKHRHRQTLEIPGGRREPEEDILRTAHRKLFEETGASRYQLVPLTAYSVTAGERRSFGLLCFADIKELGSLPDSEREKAVLLDKLPSATELADPTIQPKLFERALGATHLYRRICRSNQRHVVFDWNGTLLDDTALSVEVISSLLAEHGLKSITLDEYRQLFGFPVVEYYRKLGFDFKRHTFEEIGDQFIARYRQRIGEVRLFDGVLPMLELLAKKGIHLSILSAAAQHHLEEATDAHGIRPWLNHVFGIQDHYAASKLNRGQDLIRSVSISPAETLMIGDTDHDLEVGKALGFDVLLVADGHQKYERLKKLHENTIATRFEST